VKKKMKKSAVCPLQSQAVALIYSCMKNQIDQWMHRETAIARCKIYDNPLAAVDSTARRGERGDVVDVDFIDGYVFVDFGRGAIMCLPEEIK
jgi:hypothetical protein